MRANHTSDGTLHSGDLSSGADLALSHPLNSPSTLDPSVCRPSPDTASPRLQKSASPAAASARLPRTSSLMPLPLTVAAAATTTTLTLTPAYSPGETPSSLNVDFPPRSDTLPDTPPDDVDPLPRLSPTDRLGSVSDSIGRLRPSSLIVLHGGEESDVEILESSPSHSTSASSRELLPKMSYENARDPSYAPLQGHSRSRSGRGSMDLASKSRSSKPPSQKAMLSRALQKANTAVQLDNAHNYEGARRSYVEACDLLKHVLVKTTADEDRKKLEAIRRTYDARIEELDQILPWQTMDHKQLPAPPGSANEYEDEMLHASIVDVEREITALSVAREEAASQQQRSRQDSRYFSDGSLDTSRAARPNVEQPTLQSAFSRSSSRLRQTEEYGGESNRTSQPLTLTKRRPSSPKDPHDDRCESGEHSSGADQYHSGSWSGSRDGTGHFRDGSQNSWLDPIHESGDSSSTSVNSRDSSRPRSERLEKRDGDDTEVEFDTALDAAIEAAYDEGFEPMNPQDYDIIERTEDIVTKALRKVEEARERVRQTEREAYPDEHERPETQQQNYPKSDGFYDDSLSSDEEEHILEEMTREYNIEDFLTKKVRKISILRRPLSRNQEAEEAGATVSEQGLADGTRSRAASQNQSYAATKGWQPSAPPPQESLPELPSSRAASPGQSVRSRRLSGQNPKQLKIQTTQLRQPPATSHGEPTQPEMISELSSAIDTAIGERPQTSRSSRKLTPPTMEFSGQEPTIIGSPPSRRGQIDADDGHAGHSGSPTISRLRKNFSSSSLRSLKSRNMSLSNLDDASDMSPGTPSSLHLHLTSTRTPALPALPTPLSFALRDQMDYSSPAGFNLFEDTIHMPATPGSPNPMALDPPVALEPCPNDVMLRPFWLMRCLYQTLAHPRGGYLSTKLFVPRDVWKVKAVKLKNVEEKIANCDLLTSALLKVAKVDTCDADAMLDEMQALEGILEQVQTVLSRKLGHDVGVQGSGVLFKEASNVVEGDGAPVVPRTASVSGKSSSFSWRRLRSKNSNMGLGGAYTSRSNLSEGANKEAVTMPTLPMTPQPTSRPPKREVAQVQFVGPNASYMHALARLFDAAQAIDVIARQVDDPGLKHADKTQVGLELCTRHAAEFFGFYVCRFVLADLGLLLDKFLKRGSEWVLS
ncbi:hypothetical protein E4U35_005358 [Claviceps purpurea]|nr:hypothetical protein E4U35_005358 [Claviceps purpurea]